MPWPKFLVFNVLGAVLWVGVWTSVGYLAGGHITVIYNTVTRYSLYVLIAAVVAVAALIIRAVVRRRRRAAGDKSAGDKSAESADAESADADAESADAESARDKPAGGGSG
jgi:flagellar biosynthesis/type III secretory pathway M-ring protein FliF/YscJ